jgi:hypothetical protein
MYMYMFYMPPPLPISAYICLSPSLTPLPPLMPPPLQRRRIEDPARERHRRHAGCLACRQQRRGPQPHKQRCARRSPRALGPYLSRRAAGPPAPVSVGREGKEYGRKCEWLVLVVFLLNSNYIQYFFLCSSLQLLSAVLTITKPR